MTAEDRRERWKEVGRERQRVEEEQRRMTQTTSWLPPLKHGSSQRAHGRMETRVDVRR